MLFLEAACGGPRVAVRLKAYSSRSAMRRGILRTHKTLFCRKIAKDFLKKIERCAALCLTCTLCKGDELGWFVSYVFVDLSRPKALLLQDIIHEVHHAAEYTVSLAVDYKSLTRKGRCNLDEVKACFAEAFTPLLYTWATQYLKRKDRSDYGLPREFMPLPDRYWKDYKHARH